MDATLAQEISVEGPVVFYDGECGLCDYAVQTLIRLDKGHRLRYATLQGETAGRVLGPLEGDAGTWSVKLLEDGQLYDRSTAALRAAAIAGGMGRVAKLFLLVPRPIRDGMYRWVAAHRYRWFGGGESCMLPTPALRKRFLP